MGVFWDRVRTVENFWKLWGKALAAVTKSLKNWD